MKLERIEDAASAPPGEHRAPCPECDRGPRDGALWITVHDDGSYVWICHRCKWSGAAKSERRRDVPCSKQRGTKRNPEPAGAEAEAERRWDAASPEPGDHPYLGAKGVKAYGGIRTNNRELLIPLRDSAGRMHSLQTIRADGTKLYLKDGKTRGHYCALGRPNGRLIVCEGYATGASIHEATNDAVAVAFDCGNLEAVAKTLRGKYPDAEIVIAADDDVRTKGNPGVQHATAAALAVGGLLAIPDFGAERPDKATDFNDLASLRGLAEVRTQIAAAVPPPAPASSGVRLVRASEIEPEPIRWLWPGYLAQGALHIIAGAPGTGKTTCALAFMAAVSRGGTWPDGTTAPVGHVVIWSGEDRAADTLVPRLMAAGADLDMVHFVEAVADDGGMRPFGPATDLPLLQARLQELPGVRLLVVDPVVSAVAGDGNKNNEVRRGLQPLVDLAQRMHIAVIGISHYTKGTKGRDPIERVTGSIAFGAVARLVLGTGRSGDADGPNVITRAKSNLGPDGGGFEYRLSVTEVREGITGSYIVWGNALDGTAGEILGECECDPEERAEGQDISEWLEELLAAGPRPAKEVESAAKLAGFVWRTVQATRKRAGVETKRDGYGPGAQWVWALHRRNTPTIDPIDADKFVRAPMESMASMDSNTEDF